jgi:hypothetical protein
MASAGVQSRHQFADFLRCCPPHVHLLNQRPAKCRWNVWKVSAGCPRMSGSMPRWSPPQWPATSGPSTSLWRRACRWRTTSSGARWAGTPTSTMSCRRPCCRPCAGCPGCDLAGALDLTPQQATVRVQRMRAQLDAARAIVRALRASPGCVQLAQLARGWDGQPSTLWRKRFARHTRECDSCAGSSTDLVPADRLLIGLALVPLPAGLVVAALPPGAEALVHAGTGHSGGWFAKLATPLATKPAAAAVATMLVLGGGTVAAYGLGAFEASASSAAFTSPEGTSPASGTTCPNGYGRLPTSGSRSRNRSCARS